MEERRKACLGRMMYDELLARSTDVVSLITKDFHLWVGASAGADGIGDQLAVGCLGCCIAVPTLSRSICKSSTCGWGPLLAQLTGDLLEMAPSSALSPDYLL